MDEYNKLLRKVKELEAENAELKERLRWRDANYAWKNRNANYDLPEEQK